MRTWRQPIFWGVFSLGWFITWMFLGLLVRMFSEPEAMSGREEWVLLISLHVLAVVSALEFARKYVIRRNNSRGFPVVMQPDEKE
jgi:hypothetical protein